MEQRRFPLDSQAEAIMAAAATLVLKYGGDEICSDHLLGGMMTEPSDARNLLAEVGLTADRVESYIRGARHENYSGRTFTDAVSVPYSHMVDIVLDFAESNTTNGARINPLDLLKALIHFRAGIGHGILSFEAMDGELRRMLLMEP